MTDDKIEMASYSFAAGVIAISLYALWHGDAVPAICGLIAAAALGLVTYASANDEGIQ